MDFGGLNPATVIIAGTILFACTGLIYTKIRANHGLKNPPGPRGLPVIGNVLQVPGQHLATYFRSLLEMYGGLVSLNLAGFPIILVGDMKIAKDILEKRAAKFSSRPGVPYYRNHVDPTQSYWAGHGQTEAQFIGRKLTTGIMTSVRSGQTEPFHEFETLMTIQHLLDDGGRDWFRQIDRLAASTLLTAAFGVHCPTGNEPELREVMSCAAELSSLSTPSASIINIFPFLDWIPGPMPWRTRAKAFRKRDAELYGHLIRKALSKKAAGMNTWSAAFSDKNNTGGDQSRLVNQFAAAGIDTTAVTLHTFVLACMIYPEWIWKAQKQIDAIVGSDRMPSFRDRQYLPFVDAIVRETIRWRPAARFGIPHLSTADDVIEYNGEQYFIPARTTVFAVSWAIDHNPQRYENPDQFDPERFLDDQGRLLANYETSAFGFGRRVCPGIPFAERTLWIAIAMLLWAFDIKKSEARDPKTGQLFKYSAADSAFCGDTVNPPLEFPAVFEPRSARHAEVARREWELCEKNINVLLPTSKD